jgi:anti-anti-sigma factor
MSATVDVTLEPDRARVCIAGTLDFASLDLLDGKTAACFRDRYPIELDLSDVEFMDSAGLGGIVGMVRRAQETGVELWITESLRPQVIRLFRLTGMVQRLPIGRRQTSTSRAG